LLRMTPGFHTIGNAPASSIRQPLIGRS
jgi:hypothetical protein